MPRIVRGLGLLTIVAALAVALAGCAMESDGTAGPASAAAGSASGAEPAHRDMNFAKCDLVMIGSGGPGLLSDAIVSGPVAIRKRPIGRMVRYRHGMTAKMPILVAGHRTVRISVPRRLRGRAFLYYGRYLDRDGNRAWGFDDSPGHGATEFHPCDDKPRTVWPGGIRIRGTKPVHLRIDVEGRDKPYFLNLGRPRLYRPRR